MTGATRRTPVPAMTRRASRSSPMQTPPVDATDISGVVPILVTPFTADGEVDGDQMDRQIDFLASAGVGWVGVGVGSEGPRLDMDELSDLMSRVVRRAGDRLAGGGDAGEGKGRGGTTGGGGGGGRRGGPG